MLLLLVTNFHTECTETTLMTFSDASLPVPIVEYYMLNIYLTGKNAIIFIILPGQSRFFSIFFLRKSRLDFALCFSRNYRLFWFLQLCHNPARTAW